ncbi:thiamine diphosphokinase [Xinfangfangia sp. D13-10-4-6]|uniref:thiamine diphosphokinase n=1 Tax=Pseudogemmobacter hezensis TaxID=2737662 RepID=UPI0015536A40|nr:thiamine diphosphokinase [Pseudogemmobacter hezensis]NPD13755.1 thiamine diphosphokinase [Pseudogemmobacter hezensis]
MKKSVDQCPVLQFCGGITLIGGGPVSGRDLQLAMRLAPRVIAADGGANRLFAAGITPEAVIGDLDSILPETRAALPPGSLHHIPEQDSTDFDKALRSVRAEFILAVGFTGARLDHGLAVLNSLVRHSGRPCLVLGPKDVSFALPAGETQLRLRRGDTVSLFPFARVSGRSSGLEWPLDGHVFAPDGFIATSNRASADEVRLWLDAPGMVAILPRARLREAIRAVQQPGTKGG